jgi:formylglycine-generating enzyme required for sulfatase activity
MRCKLQIMMMLTWVILLTKPLLAKVSCPSGYVSVPQHDFCVAKFEMKNPIDATGVRRWMIGTPVSSPAGKPWTVVTRDEAAAACARIPSGTHRFSLISNNEWQAIARDAESVAGNWRDDKVGQGYLTMGHADGNPFQMLEAAGDDKPYFGTNNSWRIGWEQRRTLFLSNGEVIWDLSGNAWEWVIDDVASLGFDFSGVRDGELAGLPAPLQEAFASQHKFTSHHNIGYFRLNRKNGIRRGATYNSFGDAGLFHAAVGVDTVLADPNSGFRCVARSQ